MPIGNECRNSPDDKIQDPFIQYKSPSPSPRNNIINSYQDLEYKLRQETMIFISLVHLLTNPEINDLLESENPNLT